MNPAETWLTDPIHPLCCDTSALYFPAVLRRLRQRFPVRRILLPVIAYFERQRQLRVRFGRAYRPEVLSQNLLEPLRVEIIGCEEATALLMAQVAEQIETRALDDLMGDQARPESQARQCVVRAHAQELRNLQANWAPRLQGQQGLPSPCGQRCRLGDYLVAATARIQDALLLTADKALLDAFERYPDLFPPALPLDVFA